MSSKALCLFACIFLCGLAGAQSVPTSSHVWIINEENHGYDDVVGNSQMPYYNQLISQYGLATQFYSDQHSSLPALMWFVAGEAVETNNDTTSCEHGEDNVVRELLKQGYSWRSYQENLPDAGFQGLSSPDNLYNRRRNPLIDFTDVCPGTGQDTNSVPFTQMATDFSQNGTVNYAWVTPNVNDDADSGTLQQVDQWLQSNVPAILARPEFGPGGDGILFIVWDESDLTDDNSCSATVSQGCGGHTTALVIGPHVIPGYQSTITYHNENVLATVCAAMGLSTCPGAAQYAAPMADFFDGSAAAPLDSIRIAKPTNGATVIGTVQLIASASESVAVSQTQVWDNGVMLGVYGTQINATYNLAPGNHTTTVLDLDSNYNIIHQSSVTYGVALPVLGVQIISPTPAESFSTSTIQVIAQATEGVPINQMQVWDNGVKLNWIPGSEVDQEFIVAPGAHTLTVLDLDDNYNVLNESSVAYVVSGTASDAPAPALAYEVNLAWQAPASSTDLIAGYDIFRSSNGGATYQQLNSSVVTETAYLDSTAHAGQTYIYMVESVDASGVQSVPSDPANVAVP